MPNFRRQASYRDPRRISNPYEILFQTVKGQLLVFKHAIATIDLVDHPGSSKRMQGRYLGV